MPSDVLQRHRLNKRGRRYQCTYGFRDWRKPSFWWFCLRPEHFDGEHRPGRGAPVKYHRDWQANARGPLYRPEAMR